MTNKRRIAIVVQRYGEEVNGGSEQMARWLAEKLLHLGDVDVLTTCAQDYLTWANAYPAGKSELNGVTIYRFPVDAVRGEYVPVKPPNSAPSLADEYLDMIKQGPHSSRLLNHILFVRDHYDVFIFFTYIYATTLFGIQHVADKAIFIPTAHDEPPFYMPIFQPLFRLPAAIVCLTEAERTLIRRVMRNDGVPMVVIGTGINLPAEKPDPNRFRERFNLPERFIFYVGRIDSAKNTDELMEWFIRYKANRQHDLKLVLAGKPHIPIPSHPDIIPVGFISEQEKFDGIAASEWIVMSSLYESLSMIALEAWLAGKAMMINNNCEVLLQQIRRSQAGLGYTNYADFELTIDWLLDHPEARKIMGRNGNKYVESTYNWDVILAKFQAVFENL